MSFPIYAPGGNQRGLIEASARWRLISMLFECPAAKWRETLTALASEISDPGLREAVAAAQTEASEGLYHSTFGPGGPVSLREVSYHRSVELGGLMSELTGYYNAFGYDPSSQEPYDHVAVEAGFAGYLRLKEAYAEACQDPEHAQITAEAAQHFVKDHLGAIAESLNSRLKESGIRYLLLASRALVRETVQIEKN
jgi:nitrate reductase assembly molybdenum cofactor insertion protein NarJ